MLRDGQQVPPIHTTITNLLNARSKQSLLRSLTLPCSTYTDFSSNDFLSLSTSPVLRQTFLEELDHVDFPRGLASGGSRLLDGNSAYAEALERRIAGFHGAPAGLLSNSGYEANAGIFASLPQPGDVILYDNLIHASVHEGMRLSRAGRRVSFAHNSVHGFRQTLEASIAEDEQIGHGRRNVFVAVEAVYSMDGDLAPLREMVEVMDELLPKGNGHVVVDEAHATGCIGDRGRGLVCELGLESKVFVRLHTFAIILCSPLVRLYLINYARPLIYTTFMSFPSLAMIKSAYSLLESGKTDSLAHGLSKKIGVLHRLLRDMILKHQEQKHAGGLLGIKVRCPRSPIFPLFTSRPRSLARFCQDGGIMVRPVVFPTVPAGAQRVRVCIHAGNTQAELERLVELVGVWLVHNLQDEGSSDRDLEQPKARL